jgi:hypothetical protein
MSWKTEREGSLPDLFVRHIFTSLFYFRGYRILFPSYPYYTPGAIHYISTQISPDMRVLECGAGMSTIWYAKHVSECITIEHDKNWHNKIKNELVNRNITNSEIIFLPEKTGDVKYSWNTEWKHCAVLGRAPVNPGLKDYIFAIDSYPDRYFDIIVIDGMERLPCLLHALDKLHESGILLCDDSTRPRYKKCYEILEKWHVCALISD